MEQDLRQYKNKTTNRYGVGPAFGWTQTSNLRGNNKVDAHWLDDGADGSINVVNIIRCPPLNKKITKRHKGKTCTIEPLKYTHEGVHVWVYEDNAQNAPKAKKSAPKAKPIAPKAKKSATIAKKSAPKAKKSAPKAKTSAPKAKKSAPNTDKPPKGAINVPDGVVNIQAWLTSVSLQKQAEDMKANPQKYCALVSMTV